jgi:hypothetical protein
MKKIILKNNDFFENESHYIRTAIIRQSNMFNEDGTPKEPQKWSIPY